MSPRVSLVCAGLLALVGHMNSGCAGKAIALDAQAGASNGGVSASGGAQSSGGNANAGAVSEVVVRANTARRLQVDADRLYWATSTGLPRSSDDGSRPPARLNSCLKQDCARTLVTYDERPSDPKLATPDDVFAELNVTARGLFWVASPWDRPRAPGGFAGYSIRSCALAGCAGKPLTLVADIQVVSAMIVDDAFVYWSSAGDSAILRCPITGCDTPEVVALGHAPRSMQLDGDELYFLDERAYRMKKDGSESPAPLTPQGDSPTIELALSRDSLYWTAFEVGSMDAQAKLMSCPRLGCKEATELASGLQSPHSLKYDAGRLYWLSASELGELSGRLQAFDLESLTLEDLRSGQQFFNLTKESLAIDEHFIYWVASGAPDHELAFPEASISKQAK